MCCKMSRANASKSVNPALRMSVGLVVRPLMSGLAFNCSIPALSAPSAKILTFKSFNVLMMSKGSVVSVIFRFAQDNVRSLGQIASRKVRFLPEFLRITPINENRPAPGGMTAVHVPPAIAHHPALREVNAEFLRGAQQHARLRLATVAIGRALARMITDFHPVNGQPPAHFGMNGFDDFLFERATTHVRLVGRDDQQETRLP